jgi:3-dehydroquinate synthase
VLEFPVGEDYKSLETAGRLYGELTALGAERGTPVLALGGGVVGDVAGFVAATYMRGVPLIQLPTTLLAQVDSSIGGKVAVNHGQLKNKIGAFYQPRAVIADTSTLGSLPPTEITSGLGEVIKYAIIRDADFFSFLEESLPRIQTFDGKALEHVVTVCAGIKADVVAKDEKDLGLRNILNFGHTVGHAIETVTDFGVSHGQAVAAGIVAACVIAVEMGVFDKGVLARIARLLERAGLMTRLPDVNVAAILEAMTHDKKAVGGKIRFVLPRAIGEVFVTDEVSLALVEKVLLELR